MTHTRTGNVRQRLAVPRRFDALIALHIAISTWVLPSVSTADAQESDPLPLSSRRIVHHFDFDEREEGNLENLPKYWEAVRPGGFPHFARGTFDFEVGRTSAPSFHLESEGRNVAFGYNGPDTRVRANTDYRIVGFIRPDRLRYARACLSAHYIDRRGSPIVSSLVRSRFVGNPDELDQWIEVELYLPTAPPGAESIGLTGWVVQEPLWSNALLPRRHISRNDVFGGAWFDDITIFALPQIQLSTSMPTNLLTPDGPQLLYALLADDDDLTLHGQVSVRAVGGPVVAVHAVEVETETDAEPLKIPVADLLPGLYEARFDVFSGETLVRSKAIIFARLAALRREGSMITRSFGVVLDPRGRVDPASELALLELQAVHSAKIPVWSGLAEEGYSDRQRRAMDRLTQDLVRRGFSLSGVFLAPPAPIVRSDGAYTRPLLELLAGDRAVWNQHLAASVAPTASAFRWWEIAAPVGTSDVTEGQLNSAINHLRDAMRPFITFPRLSVPVSTTVAFTPQKLPVEHITLRLDGDTPTEAFGSLVGRAKELGYEQVSVLVTPLPTDEYRRLPRLFDWARRLLVARHAGADTVFVPQTWLSRDTVDGRIVEPKEEFLLLRTIANVVGDASAGPTLRIGNGVRCLVFHRERSSVLAIWDEQTSPDGRPLTIQLGSADRQIDLWGRTTPLKRDPDGRQVVTIGRAPVFVPDVERWLIEFRTALSIDPAVVPSGSELVEHRVELDYAGDRSVAARIEWKVPESWEIRPRGLDVTVSRQQPMLKTIEVVYPHNETAGLKAIQAHITFAVNGMYMEVPLSVRIGASDLEVSAMAVVERGELVLRQVVSNRSTEVLSFRASAAVPGHQRQYRPISNLRPGDTHSVQYRFANGESLVGRRVRLALREVNDGPRVHNLEILIP